MVRGLEQRAIFGDEDNRRDFVQRLGDARTRTGACVLAWALLPNHVHLLGWRRYGQLCGTAVLRRAPAGFGADRAQSPNGRYEFVNKFPSKEYRTAISLCIFARITPISGFLHKLYVRLHG
jgi:hypothetical protein